MRERRGECPAGSALVTSGGRLRARWVVHAVGPFWRGGEHGEDDALRGPYRHALHLALDAGARSIAFPSIGTGAYGFPIERAAPLAVGAARRFIARNAGLAEVRFVAFSHADYEVYAPLFAPI
ncbi:MAG: macro domain-containing protein [Candidatus Polarisedimenticolia bacterium]